MCSKSRQSEHVRAPTKAGCTRTPLAAICVDARLWPFGRVASDYLTIPVPVVLCHSETDLPAASCCCREPTIMAAILRSSNGTRLSCLSLFVALIEIAHLICFEGKRIDPTRVVPMLSRLDDQ
jgi:hypothetical protein